MMSLQTLLPDVAGVPGVEVQNLTIDSRKVSDGGLFMALQGHDADGHEYIDAAVQNGAVAVLAQRDVPDCSVPVVVLPDLAVQVSRIAGTFYGDPSQSMHCVAVTGTNGKTSVAHFVATLAQRIGVRAGFMGTTGWGLVGSDLPLAASALTTADAVSLQEQLAALRANGCELVALEMSSHALQQHRADGLHIDVALFTNLSRDHLDYHATMAEYGAAKARLFEFESLTGAVINVDDAFGLELAGARERDARVLTLTAQPAVQAVPTDELLISDIDVSDAGLGWELMTPWGQVSIETPVIGAYNATNLSTAVAALALLGFDLEAVVAAVPSVPAPAGRLQPVALCESGAQREPGGVRVYVDYAHTPDALVSMLGAVRAHCTGRLLCVFGCGGDRDRGKRGPMGLAVSQGADIGYLTSDNPRFESPESIIDDVLAAQPEGHSLRVQPDRRRAIAEALAEAEPGDVVVIAGKGHEDYQDIQGERLSFDDAAVALELLHSLSAKREVH